MAKQIKYYVTCPECSEHNMAVADKSVSSGRVPMLFGHCKSCGHMMQSKAHQEYLKQADQASEDQSSEPPFEPVVMSDELEDFNPAVISQGVEKIEEEAAPIVAEKSGGFRKVLIGLGIAGLAVLGFGAMKSLGPSS